MSPEKEREKSEEYMPEFDGPSFDKVRESREEGLEESSSHLKVVKKVARRKEAERCLD